VFESLTESLSNVFRRLSGKGRLTEKNVEEGLREVRLALLQADVNYRVVKEFMDRVTPKALGQEVLKGLNPTQQFIKLIYDEMVALLGPVDHAFPQPQSGPLVVMMVGLQGSGKTTTCVKLAVRLRRQGRAPYLVAADVVRPAAVEQLKALGARAGVPVYAETSGRPVKICARGIQQARSEGAGAVILDTQGRLHIDRELMDELVEIRDAVKPHSILLVCDAMTGQDALNSAEQFHKALGIDGVILTKMDGDARGGAAMSIKAVTGRPIRFVGVGEKPEDLEEFHPERVAQRILGMGDVVTLAEKMQEAFDAEQARRLQEKILKDELTLEDFLKQLQTMKKMGPLSQILKLIPGAAQNLPEVDESEFRRMEAIIQSMTPEERENPEILNPSRRKRIARGSGTSVVDVDKMVRQFEEARRMIRELRTGKVALEDIMESGGRLPKRKKPRFR
jgi:signal recognition particle subunit SRP54